MYGYGGRVGVLTEVAGADRVDALDGPWVPVRVHRRVVDEVHPLGAGRRFWRRDSLRAGKAGPDDRRAGCAQPVPHPETDRQPGGTNRHGEGSV